MQVLKFTLKGNTAFFKKPDVNSCYYFTYGNIHKVALLGIFGAVLGYGGYNRSSPKTSKRKKDEELPVYPEYYEKLKDIEVSIVPKCDGGKGFFQKKIQIFNNSVGYASQEQGGNLIVKEQWIEYPVWDIYVLVNCDESRKLLEFIKYSRSIFIPYLGKNDHPADILNIEIFDDAEEITEFTVIDSLFINENAELFEDDWSECTSVFKYEEYLPLGLDEITNMYILRKFLYTNMNIRCNNKVLRVGDRNIAFF